ncbi:hypothetical protein FOL47_001287 [Perkinsus chesapeaki]|uniref:Uncharacterized protein n=1 Tax=Perkinsus chesapeaki TaxID=330153 RepID=A0A7J6N0R0_PERCH|nr:hypothetical protein FOL47_001287 [Perkinsus chesapeaki]
MSLPEIETLVHNVAHPPVREHDTDIDIDAIIEGEQFLDHGSSELPSLQTDRLQEFMSPHNTLTPLHSVGIRCSGPVKLLHELAILLSGSESHEFVLETGDKEIDIDKLVKQDLDARDAAGKTALHHAAQWGSSGVVIEMCRLGATVDAKDNRGRTPLHAALLHPVHEGSEDVIRCLINNKADPLVADQDGCTPLSAAVDAPTVIRLLVVSKAFDSSTGKAKRTKEPTLGNVASRPGVRREAARICDTDDAFSYDGSLPDPCELSIYDAARRTMIMWRNATRSKDMRPTPPHLNDA